MSQNKQGQKTPRSIKYSNAALAGKQVTINGQNFGLFVVDGQNVYLGIEEPTEPLDGIYYPIYRWKMHHVRNIEGGINWVEIRTEIDKQIETAVIYGVGIKKGAWADVAIIKQAKVRYGISELNKAKCNEKTSTDLGEIKAFLGEKYPNLQIIEQF